MRISCVAIGRVVDPQGRYLVFTDQRRAELGTRTLMPLGLPITTTRKGMQHLIHQFHAHTFEDAQRRELRFRIADNQVQALQLWFTRGTDLVQPDLSSELHRRLANAGIQLRRGDARSIRTVLLGTTCVEADSTRLRLPERRTVYLMTVSDLVIPTGLWERILNGTAVHAVNSPYSLLRKEDITPARISGAHVSPICQALLLVAGN